jgi:uncharacterized protein YegL
MTDKSKAKSEPLEQHNLTTSHFGFSAKNVDELGATEYTLVTIAVDISGSVASFKGEMEKCLQEIIDACRKSPRADNLMVRVLTFSNNLDEMHGFKLLQECAPGDYADALNVGGMTALCDATVNAIEALGAYGKTLVSNDYDANGILIVITDGADNNSTNTVQQAAKVVKNINKDEALESLVTILVGVNVSDPQISKLLNDFKDKVGFTQYIEIGNANAKTLAKLAKFVSQSISSQSKALGTGGPSKPLSF